MKSILTKLMALLGGLHLIAGDSVAAVPSGAAAADKNSQGVFELAHFPDDAKFKVLGLGWFEQNAPKLWRMPARELESLPKGVQERSKSPSGGRILMRCNTRRLGLTVETKGNNGFNGFQVCVDGRLRAPAAKEGPSGEPNLILCEDLGDQEKEIVIYLPHHNEVAVKAVAVDINTKFSAPGHKYAKPLPVVFYGSSVCQGQGTPKSGMTYEAILCRELNLDFVNLGFGGAGKAEKNVVELVNSIPACCYVFDLGKSYGAQDGSAYKAMLQTVRKSHPEVPIICVTPITSAREMKDKSYSERSVHTRAVMRDAFNELVQSGEKNLLLVEGPDLLGFSEHAGLSKDGVHPSDQGYSLIASKLSPVLKKALGL